MKARLPIAALFCGIATVAFAQAPTTQPVVLKRMIFDGKPSYLEGAFARIVGLKNGGDGFVSVRAAPSVKAAERDRLTGDRSVWSMPVAKGASFVAVIYADADLDGEVVEKICNLPNPPPDSFPVKQVYTGPGKHGWVHKRFVEVLAD